MVRHIKTTANANKTKCIYTLEKAFKTTLSVTSNSILKQLKIKTRGLLKILKVLINNKKTYVYLKCYNYQGWQIS